MRAVGGSAAWAMPGPLREQQGSGGVHCPGRAAVRQSVGRRTGCCVFVVHHERPWAMARSALTVEDLVRSPALQLVVVAGAAGLDRAVGWAHVSEVEDPTPWLVGQERLMTTGIAVPLPADRQRAYLERLDDAGVAALALSEQLRVPPL